MRYVARKLLLGVGLLLPLLASGADLDEVTIQVIDLDSERPEAVTRQIELPEGGEAVRDEAAVSESPPGAAKRDAGPALVREPAEPANHDNRAPERSMASERRAEPDRSSRQRGGVPEGARPAGPERRPASEARPDRELARERGPEERPDPAPQAVERAKGLERAREVGRGRDETGRSDDARARGQGRGRP